MAIQRAQSTTNILSLASTPSMETIPDTVSHSDLMVKLERERKAARDHQERRHMDWLENYELYRNRVRTNRLTQRQAVNIPLMKETIKTLLSKVDDPPSIEWKELGGDQEKEIVMQATWDQAFDTQNFESVDIQDKKTVLLYGRGFKKLNWADDHVAVTALDIFDIVVDPMADPLDLETANYLLHQNIFRPLRDILADDRYTEEGKNKLKTWITSEAGIVASAENQEEWKRKMERLRAMGIQDSDFATFAGGEVIVNLTEHYTKVWNKDKKKFERRVVVYANNEVELSNDLLKDLVGVEFWPFVTWGEDVETQDIWSDGPADLVRTPNKILNVWFSQMVENRTLRNFQMHWYDATIGNYTPQTYEPGPGRMLPAPGDPSKTIQPVQVQGLDETLTAIDFLIRIIERGTAATAIEKGVSEKKQITLGEVELLVGKAMERTASLAKFYRRSWEELASKWYEILNANSSKKTVLYKTSADGKIWPKVVYASDWKSERGYKAMARSSSEQEAEQTKSVQIFQFLLSQFPNNQALRKIAEKRMLELVQLSPEELREIEEAEETIPQAQEAPVAPEQSALEASIQQSLAELDA